MKNWFLMKKKNATTLEIMIYDEIGGWGIDAKQFVQDLKARVTDEIRNIRLRINSPGGSVFDGIAIYNALVSLANVKIRAVIDGYAASIASMIAMAADYIEMPENTFLMIHDPLILVGGDSKDHKRYAKLLDGMKDTIINAYLRHAKDKNAEEIASLMEEETWFTAAEARDQGFIEEVTEPREIEKSEDMNFASLKVPVEVLAVLCPSKKRDPVSPVVASVQKTTLNIEEVCAMKLGFDKKGNLVDLDDSSKIVKTVEQFKKEGVDTTKLHENPSEREQVEAREAAKIEAAQEAKKAEKARARTIRDLGAATQYPQDEIEKMVKEDTTVEAAQAKMIEHARTRMAPVGPQVGTDQKEKEQAGIVNALLVRAGIEKDRKKIQENRESEFAGFGLQTTVKHFLERAGAKNVGTMDSARVGEGFLDLIYGTGRVVPRMAMSMNTNDLESALSTVQNISLLKGYETAETTFQLVSGTGSLGDLKQAELYKLSEGPNVLEIPEGQAPKLSRISDRREVVTLVKYGRAWSATEQMIINDRLDVITKLPERYGRSMADEQNFQYWNTLLSGTGPNLNEDGTNVFTAAHGNYVAAGAGGAIAVATLAAAFQAFINFQTFSPDGGQSRNRYLNIKPAHLAVGPSRMLNANRFTSSVYTPGATNEELNLFGPQGKWNLTPFVEPLIDTINGTPWLLFANAQALDYGLFLTLAGRDTPRVSSKVGGAGEVKGIIYDIEHYWVIKFADYRGIYKNMGV